METSSINQDRSRPASVGFRQSWALTVAMTASDIVTLEVCLYLAGLAHRMLGDWFPAMVGPSVHVGIAAGMIVVPIVYLMMGLYPGYGLSDVERLRRQVIGVAIALSCLIVWDYLARDGEWSRAVLLVAWLLATFLVPLVSALMRRLADGLGIWGTPVVLVGAREPGAQLIRRLRASRRLGLVPIAIMDFDDRNFGAEIEGVPVVGSLATAGELSRFADICVIAVPELDGGRLALLSEQLPFPHVVLIPDLHGLQSNWVTARDIGGLLGIEIRKNLLLPHNRYVKRALDLLVTFPAFVITAPLLFILGAAICAVSPGNPIYWQTREGLHGRRIRLLKLRTMWPDAESVLERHLVGNPADRAQWNRYFRLEHDPRVLPVIGGFLRRSGLDRLPQLWNVLCGDMSLVGPKPYPYYHLEKFDGDFRRLRKSVAPGLTGLSQVEDHGGVDAERDLDTYYIRNWSVWLDIIILCRAVGAVLTGKEL